jgi:hypothetical protein
VIGKAGTRNPEEITKREERKKNLEEGRPEAAPSESKKLFSHSR